MSMSELVSIRCDGVINTHIFCGGNYLTICGVDGDDEDKACSQETLRKTGKTVDCSVCIGLWRKCRTIKLSQIKGG